MKNKKFKLFASLTSLVMVVAVMAVGVWAATSASVTASGTASFSVVGIGADVKVAAGSDIGTANDEILSVTVAQSNPAAGEWDFNIAYSSNDADANGSLVNTEKTLKFTITPAQGSAAVFYKVAATALGNTEGKAAVVEIKDIYTTAANTEGQEVTTLAASQGTTEAVTINVVFEVTSHTGAALTADNALVQGFTIALSNAIIA